MKKILTLGELPDPDPFTCVCEDGSCTISGEFEVRTSQDESIGTITVEAGGESVEPIAGTPSETGGVTTTPYTFSIPSLECDTTHTVTISVEIEVSPPPLTASQDVSCPECTEGP